METAARIRVSCPRNTMISMRKSFAWSNVLPFLLAVTFPVCAEETPPANLLPNPSFEEVAEADGVAGWMTRAWHGEAEGKWSVVSPGRTSARCVSIESEQGTDAAWTVTVAVRPNTFYRLSGWLKTEKVRGAVGALLNIQNMQHVRTPPVKGTTDWTRVSTVFHTQTETRIEINCLFGGWGSSTGRAWYDDLSLVEIDLPTSQMCATATIDTDGPRVEYSPMIFGGFIEHFHHQIYGGIYQPDSKLSDENGFRRDVIEGVKELKVSIVRWPGGCFASGYHWRDGVGPNRQAKPDPVWGDVDPNTFGTDEFVHWCRLDRCRALHLHQRWGRYARGNAPVGRVLQPRERPACQVTGKCERRTARRSLLEHRQ